MTKKHKADVLTGCVFCMAVCTLLGTLIFLVPTEVGVTCYVGTLMSATIGALALFTKETPNG